MDIDFRDAKLSDFDLLKSICIRSKGYWGHSKEWLDELSAFFEVNEDYVVKGWIRLVLLDGEVIGFYGFELEELGKLKLDHLWLLPDFIGGGIGRTVWLEVLAHAKREGFESFVLDSDPDAAGFYERMGAEKIGEVWNDFQQVNLPVMRARCWK